MYQSFSSWTSDPELWIFYESKDVNAHLLLSQSVPVTLQQRLGGPSISTQISGHFWGLEDGFGVDKAPVKERRYP